MFVLYNLVVFLYWCTLKVASLFHAKAKLWVRGRKNSFVHIENTLKQKNIFQHPNIIWFHCASLGEFEQGRPVIENLKAKDKAVKIVLTFFSPSGYEIRKDYEFADAVFYLPIDFKSNAHAFVSLVRPKTAVFVKYEFWLNYIAELKEQNIPTYLTWTKMTWTKLFSKPWRYRSRRPRFCAHWQNKSLRGCYLSKSSSGHRLGQRNSRVCAASPVGFVIIWNFLDG